MMEVVSGNNATNENPKLPSQEVTAQQTATASTIRTEEANVPASENTTSVVSEASAPQYFNLPVLQEGCVDPQQSYILATTAEGNTILVEASQLALLSDQQSIPLYDGSNIYQLASQTVLDSNSLIFSKETEEALDDPGNIIESNLIEKGTSLLHDKDDIMPPDRKGQYKCDSCENEFSSEKQLMKHYWKIHAEDKPNRCSQCDASFNKKSNLLLHEATHCTSDPTCPICHRKFQRLAGLKSHMLFHKTEESLVCSECGEEFSTQSKLDKHIQEHVAELTMDQSFICRICKKGFHKLAHLKEHQKIHYRLKTSLHRRHYKRNFDRSTFPHKCYFCGKQFQKPSQLVRHNRIHTGERPYKCDMCERAFNQKGALLIHKAKHTGVRPYACDFCPAAFAQKGNLRNHIRRVHSLLTVESTAGVHKCELCTCVFRKIGSLNAHMNKAHAASSLSFLEISKGEQNVSNALNQIMEMSKTTRPDLHEENIKKIAVESNVSADILQQALENSGLVSTEQNNDPSRPYVMTVADSATGVLRRHIMRDIGGVKWYQCVYCTKEFKKPSDLVRHIRIHTHEKPYKCDQCYRAFAVKSTLSAHIRTHTGAKDYSCEHCKKLFSTSGSLKVHLLLHTGARPFSCTICGKAFRTSGHKNTHLATHSREKSVRKPRKSTKFTNVDEIVDNIALQEPILITDEGLVQPVSKNIAMQTELDQSDRPYRCNICQKAFKKSSHLKQHIRSHTGEKPYNCPQCEKSFVSNGVLKAHLRTHTGTKTFACHLCTAAFTTNGSLKRHMCIHSSDRPYMCPYCQKTFKTSMNCKKHMNTHRYELALGMGGVAVTVVQEGGQNHDLNGKEIESSNISASNGILEDVRILSGTDSRPIITLGESYTCEPETILPTAEVITQMPQQLTHEVYNTQTGMIEQVEIVTQSQEIEQTSNNLFLSISDFSGNQLTLQPEAASEEFIPSNAEVEISNVENTLQQESVNKTIEASKSKGKRRVKLLKKPFQCEQCSKVFKKSSHLKQHIFSHTGEKRFRCTTCGDMFSYAKVLQQHIKAKHEHRKDFKCHVCTSEFAAKSSLIRHMTLHDVSQPYHCAYCNNKFSSKEHYRQHLKESHSNAFTEEDHLEEVNGESTTIQIPEETETSLNLGNVETVFMQTVTEKDQDTREFLPKHQHLCPQCSKSFKKPSDLIRHMRIHTGERPYKCESCGKAFTVKSTLDSHQKTHTGEKNFSCHVCMSLFATKGSLKVHMRLHTGSRPFKCPHCEMHFRTSGHRKSHVASHFKQGGHFKQGSRKKKLLSHLNDNSLFAEVNDANPPTETIFPVVSVAEDTVNMTHSTSGMQVPNSNQTTIQLQPSNLVNPNIHFIDPSLMPKTIQIDASVWQQLQQHLNFNITIDPSLTNPLNTKNGPDSNQTQILNVDGVTTSTVPGAFTINPNMIIHQLGFTINPQQQNEMQSTENVTLIIPENTNKTGNGEEYQTTELFDSQVLTLETNTLGETEIVAPNKTSIQETFVNNCNVATFAEGNSSIKEAVYESIHKCDICEKVFKTTAQLKRHSKTHKVKPKDIYHCQACNKDFKKNNQFLKHLQTHK